MTVRRSIAFGVALAGSVLGTGLAVGRPAAAVTVCALGTASALALTAVRRLAADAAPSAPRSRAGLNAGGLEQLRQVSRQLAAAQASEWGVDRELRPLFRTIARARLARRGVDLDRHAESARLVLGTALWEIVRSDGQSRVGGAIDAKHLRELIERLEEV